MSRPVRLGKSFRLGKDGRRVERNAKALDVSARQRQRPGGSKRVRVARRGEQLRKVRAP
jgi:hypothetical protein